MNFCGRNFLGEHGVFTFRLDIVQYAGRADFSPMLWELNAVTRSLRPNATPLPDNLSRSTEEEKLEAALAFIDSRGAGGGESS